MTAKAPLDRYWLHRRHVDVSHLARALDVPPPTPYRKGEITPIAFRMPKALIDDLDAAAERFGATRTALVELLLRHGLTLLPQPKEAGHAQTDLFA